MTPVCVTYTEEPACHALPSSPHRSSVRICPPGSPQLQHITCLGLSWQVAGMRSVFGQSDSESLMAGMLLLSTSV